MIEMLYPQNGPASLQGPSVDANALASKGFLATGARQDSRAAPSEEHMRKEMGLRRGPVRAPRRSQTHADYQLPSAPAHFSGTMTIHNIQQLRSQQPPSAAQSAVDIPETILETGITPPDSRSVTPPSAIASPAPANGGAQTSRPRPPLAPPRRSYSVIDYEPEPQFHRPSSHMVLEDLPGELHYAIFDFLDPIDSTCLGLANKHFYAIHRRMHGAVPLSARRDGPNELEWAWHLAGRDLVVDSDGDLKPKPAAEQLKQQQELEGLSDKEKSALAALRVRGQGLCRKCGVSRCELHKHIREWMGGGYEYCEVRQRFGPAAPEGARAFCYMSNPQNPSRCGRHRVRKPESP